MNLAPPVAKAVMEDALLWASQPQTASRKDHSIVSGGCREVYLNVVNIVVPDSHEPGVRR
jgi:hypothetical protein